MILVEAGDEQKIDNMHVYSSCLRFNRINNPQKVSS